MIKADKIKAVLTQDFGAFRLAIDNDNFRRGNIYANRFMSNAMLSDDSLLMFPGFLMKETALHLQAVQGKDGPVSTAKGTALDFVKKLQGGIQGTDVDVGTAWSNYRSYFEKMRTYIMDKEEKKAYKTDLSFVSEVMTWAASFLNERRELLPIPNSSLIKGVLNEIDRVHRVHGGDEPALIRRSLIAAFDRILDYYIQAYSKDEESFRKRVSNDLFPVLDTLTEAYSAELGEKDFMLKATELLCDLAKRWRELFVEYMEVPRLVGAAQPMIQIPAEAKEKVTQAIAEGLEKEIKKA